MLHQTTDSADEACGRLSASDILALHESEIKQLAAVNAHQQRNDELHSLKLANYATQAMSSVDAYQSAPPQLHNHHVHPQHHSRHLQQLHHADGVAIASSVHGTVIGSNDLAHPSVHAAAPLESPEYLAHRLLVEFGKTRTNYNSLVPRIVEVMRMFRDYGPMRCPLPVVSNLDELLNDEALIRIEQRYPNSIEAGFLVLCTERRALRSGGGGKYYFIDVSGRLVGCHKSDLPSYAEKDPRCKSSNPQRLLEFYENLVKEGKASDIQRLVRVWSMEIYPETPYDSGFPHCTLLWVKRMHVSTHITKWKHSQWQTSQLRGHDMYVRPGLASSLNHASALPYMTHVSMDVSHHADALYRAEGMSTEEILTVTPLSLNGNSKRRRITEACGAPITPSSFECWNGSPVSSSSGCHPVAYGTNTAAAHPKNNVDDVQHNSAETHCGIPTSGLVNTVYNLLAQGNVISWDIATVQTLYTGFAEFAPLLQKGDIMDWSVQLVDRLAPPVLEAAMHLIESSIRTDTGRTENPEERTADNDKALRYDILRKLCEIKERDRMTEGLRILLACLLQQQRLEEFLPPGKSNVESHTPIRTTSTSSTTIPSSDSELHSNALPLNVFHPVHLLKSVDAAAPPPPPPPPSSYIPMHHNFESIEGAPGATVSCDNHSTSNSSYGGNFGGVNSGSASCYSNLKTPKLEHPYLNMPDVVGTRDADAVNNRTQETDSTSPNAMSKKKSFLCTAVETKQTKPPLFFSKREADPVVTRCCSETEKENIFTSADSYTLQRRPLLTSAPGTSLERKTPFPFHPFVCTALEQNVEDKLKERMFPQFTAASGPCASSLCEGPRQICETSVFETIDTTFLSRFDEKEKQEKRFNPMDGISCTGESPENGQFWNATKQQAYRSLSESYAGIEARAGISNEPALATSTIKTEPSSSKETAWVGVEHWNEGEETLQDDVDNSPSYKKFCAHENESNVSLSTQQSSFPTKSDSSLGTAFLLSVLYGSSSPLRPS